MAIKVGDKLPDATLIQMAAEGPQPMSTSDLFAGKKVVLFAVPGAFTPTCHRNHLPGFVAEASAIRAKGVDEIACVSVNDAFVMDAWAKATGADGKITMLADGNGDFAKALGLELDLSALGLGVRSQRYAMILEDGTVQALYVEGTPKEAEASGAKSILAQL